MPLNSDYDLYSKGPDGASQSPLVDGDARCPLWGVHEAFSRPGEVIADLVELAIADFAKARRACREPQMLKGNIAH